MPLEKQRLSGHAGERVREAVAVEPGGVTPLSKSSECPARRGELIERAGGSFASQLLQKKLEQHDPVFSSPNVCLHLGLELAHYRYQPARIARYGTNEEIRLRPLL